LQTRCMTPSTWVAQGVCRTDGIGGAYLECHSLMIELASHQRRGRMISSVGEGGHRVWKLLSVEMGSFIDKVFIYPLPRGWRAELLWLVIARMRSTPGAYLNWHKALVRCVP
jgi:hypothetical protein